MLSNTLAVSLGLFASPLSAPAAQTVDVTRVGRWSSPCDYGLGYAVAGSNNYAYLVPGATGLQVLDISNPAKPVPVGSASVSAKAIALSGSHAYLAGYSGSDGARLQIVDITNPASPVPVGATNTSGARKWTTLSAVRGTISSLIMAFTPSASGCRIPKGPTRFGPYRF